MNHHQSQQVYTTNNSRHNQTSDIKGVIHLAASNAEIVKQMFSLSFYTHLQRQITKAHLKIKNFQETVACLTELNKSYAQKIQKQKNKIACLLEKNSNQVNSNTNNTRMMKQSKSFEQSTNYTHSMTSERVKKLQFCKLQQILIWQSDEGVNKPSLSNRKIGQMSEGRGREDELIEEIIRLKNEISLLEQRLKESIGNQLQAGVNEFPNDEKPYEFIYKQKDVDQQSINAEENQICHSETHAVVIQEQFYLDNIKSSLIKMQKLDSINSIDLVIKDELDFLPLSTQGQLCSKSNNQQSLVLIKLESKPPENSLVMINLNECVQSEEQRARQKQDLTKWLSRVEESSETIIEENTLEVDEIKQFSDEKAKRLSNDNHQ